MRVFWKLSPLLYLFLVPDGNPKDIVEQIDQELNIEDDDDDDDDVKLSDAPPPAEPAKGAAAAAAAGVAAQGGTDQKSLSPFSWSALGALAFIAIMPLLITSMELSITYYALPVLGAIIVPCVEIYSDNKQGGGGTYLPRENGLVCEAVL